MREEDRRLERTRVRGMQKKNKKPPAAVLLKMRKTDEWKS